ncbi:MAG: bifunctional folylpolyglutamate synthase/dihydrofolate synthase [Frankiales bacterium]|nr:bifunctional folylpolyglutamate synthase/dihydrofolate synthase [Frankiales bacterium]
MSAIVCGRRNLFSVDDDAREPATAPVGLAAVEKALEGRFPTRMVPDLDRITDLLDILGSPQRSYPSVHITGTNGKTTTARMIDALLREFGVRTGRYTSPHLHHVVERIAVDGMPVEPDRFVAAYDDIAPYLELVDSRHPDRLTFFEVLTAMAFATFADVPVDAAVVEVGLGGRWDATNVVDAPVAVVTPIGLDHVGILGDTVEAIAGEKAGIFRAGASVACGPQPAGAARVLAEHAAAVDARLFWAGTDFGVRRRSVAVGGQLVELAGLGGDYAEVFLPLHGAHQAGNAATALAAVEAFFGVRGGPAEGRGPLDGDVVRSAFASVTSPGRLEIVRRSPTVILDGAHNPAGAAALAEALGEAFTFDRLVAVVAVLDDKDAAGLLAALEPVVDAVVATSNTSPRALPAEALAAVAADVLGGDRVSLAARLDDAIEVAVALAEADGLGGGVLVTGSIVTVGDARQLLAPGAAT